MRGLLKRLTPTIGIPLIVASIIAGFALAISVTASAQYMSGRGVDMRSLSGQAASCRTPALRLKREIMVLRQDLSEILECNSEGSFFLDGDCVPYITPEHAFSPDHTGDPDNRDALSFHDPDVTQWAKIGGADGANVECVPQVSCEPGSPHWPSCFCDNYPDSSMCTDDEDDEPECSSGHQNVACCDQYPSPVCEDDCDPTTDEQCPGFCDENPEHVDCITTCQHPCSPSARLVVGAGVTVYEPGSWTCDSGGYTSTLLTCKEDGTMTDAPWSSYVCSMPEEPEDCAEPEPDCAAGETLRVVDCSAGRGMNAETCFNPKTQAIVSPAGNIGSSVIRTVCSGPYDYTTACVGAGDYVMYESILVCGENGWYIEWESWTQ